ncbi:MAG: CoA transferase [Firmicutes bacterium]|nr:CoA transferase [Bacillota bacterium]
MTAPLSGVRVLDVSRFVSGPLCTFYLASLGAEVIAVEAPEPSPSRRLGPFALPGGGAAAEMAPGAVAMPFLKRARGKRSVAVDIRAPEGQDVVRALARRCDVFVDNSSPGVMARFGLAYDDLVAENAGLVYCAISGYGQGAPGRLAATATGAGGGGPCSLLQEECPGSYTLPCSCVAPDRHPAGGGGTGRVPGRVCSRKACDRRQ